MNRTICIGGGVGPMAGVDLHNKIIANTTAKTDQEHFNVYHFSRSSDIVDRTDFLQGKSDNNPAYGMFRTVQIMTKSTIFESEEYDVKEPVIGIPCNTFHAPQIFNIFIGLLEQAGINAKIINIVDETIQYVLSNHPHIEKIGLLSTTGTRDFNVYDKKLKENFKHLIKLPDNLQTKIQGSIYNPEYGIKAKSSPVSNEALSDIKLCANYLKNNGAEVIFLACTELPLALPDKDYENIPLIDTVTVLAKALIRESKGI